jgi:hypothetical protein
MARISEGDRMIEALWTSFSPFRGMQDANRGSFEQRVAAYRHNRSMRRNLLACLGRWTVSCFLAIALTTYFQSHASGPGVASALFALLGAVGGLIVTVSVCVLTTGACAYLHLEYDQR